MIRKINAGPLQKNYGKKDNMAEIFISTDVETDGPIPGPYSMLNFASAAYKANGERLGTFTANLETLPGAATHPDSMEFWHRHPDVWADIRSNLQSPAEVMPRYAAWLEALPGKPIFVGYPIAFDFMFVYWYLMRFHGESPFGHNGIDIRTYAMALLKIDYRDANKNDMPRRWRSKHPHTHNSLDDAIEQGELFTNMLRDNLS
jgi:hypothetical protein